MAKNFSLRAALRRPWRAIEETVITIVLLASVALPVIHLIPGGSDGSASAVVAQDLNCASGFDAEQCEIAQGAMDWAAEVTAWKFTDTDDNDDMIDAFSQCIWTGAVAQRIGPARATVVATTHEKSRDQSDDAMQMAFANITVGTAVGEQSNTAGGTDTWGWIIDECESHATNEGLYGPGGVLGRY